MSFSTQHKLNVIRPPRVKLTYDVEIGGAFVTKELPYVFGIISDLSGASSKKPLKERKFVEIDGANFSDIMKAIKPSVSFVVDNKLSGNGKINIDLGFYSMDNFSPMYLVENIQELSDVFSKRSRMNDLLAKIEGSEELYEMLTKIVSTPKMHEELLKAVSNGPSGKVGDITFKNMFTLGKLAIEKDQEAYAIEMLRELAVQLIASRSSKETCAIAFSKRVIASFDKLLSRQLDLILHHPDYQALESSWRGLYYLLDSSTLASNIKARVLNASKEELLKDLTSVAEFDQTNLFKKVYEEEYGTFGGNPYSCLIGDYFFGRNAQDMDLLRRMSEVACAAHAPFIAGAHPTMFDMETFGELSTPRDMAQLFESSELAAWRGFRESEESRYVALALPRILIRLPYGEDNPVKGLNYSEGVIGDDNRYFCWGNAAYALAQRIIDAAAQYNWTTAIRGVEGGGMVRNLPAYTYKSEDGDVILKCPSETIVTDRREKELSDLGFISLCHCKGTDYSVFFGSQTTQKPELYSNNDATSNAELSARLTYILAASRFAHYLKAMMRDKVGKFMSKDEVSTMLNTWLARYILLSDEATQDVKARFPLREGRVDVVADESRPGAYEAIVYLRPHFQLEELTGSIRLVAKLPTPKG